MFIYAVGNLPEQLFPRGPENNELIVILLLIGYNYF